MARLGDMIKPGKEYQISFQSTREVVSRLDLATTRLAVREQFGGKKLRTGHLVNAIAYWLASLPDDELCEFAAPLLRKLEVHWERGDGQSGSVEAVAGEPVPPRKAHGRLVGSGGKGEVVRDVDEAERENHRPKRNRRPVR